MLIFNLILFSFGVHASANTAPNTSSGLTIQSAIQEALRQNALLKNAKEVVTQDDRTMSLAFSQVFPVISGTGIAQDQKAAVSAGFAPFNGNAYSSYNYGLKATQTIWDGGAILGGYAFAKKQKDMDQYTVDANQRDLILQVVTDFYGVLYNQRLLETLHRTLTAIQESVKTTDRFYHIGRAQLTDLLTIKTTEALLIPQINQAETAVLTNMAHLDYDLGSSEFRKLEISSDFIIPEKTTILDMVKTTNERPEIARIHKQIDQFDDTRIIQLAPNWPQISAYGTVGKTITDSYSTSAASSSSWTLGVQLTVPLFSGLSFWRERAVLDSQGRELEYQRDDLNNQMHYNEVSARDTFNSAVSVLASDEIAFKLADAALKESQKNYKLQTINMLTLVQNQQNYLQASSAFDNAKYQFITAAGALFVAKGIPIDKLTTMLH